MKILSLFNIKGGVGKTASAVNLAYLAARDGASTLLWDLDPQGAATFYFRVRPRIRGGARKLILGRRDLGELVRGSDFERLDVLPADFSYRRMDDALREAKRPEGQLSRLVSPFESEYSYLFLDCAPSISALSESVFSASDVLLCPTIPTTLSLRTLAQLMKHLKRREGPRPLVLPFFCMVDRRKSLHRRVCEWVEEEQFGFLSTRIPYSSLVEQMGIRRKPLLAYSPSSAPARAYQALWDEVRARVAGEEDGRDRIYAKKTRHLLEEAARSGPDRE